jgi:hypothetical protein
MKMHASRDAAAEPAHSKIAHARTNDAQQISTQKAGLAAANYQENSRWVQAKQHTINKSCILQPMPQPMISHITQ